MSEPVDAMLTLAGARERLCTAAFRWRRTNRSTQARLNAEKDLWEATETYEAAAAALARSKRAAR